MFVYSHVISSSHICLDLEKEEQLGKQVKTANEIFSIRPDG